MEENETFDDRLKNALTSELISYVAGYRALGLNKKQSISCMIELDKRRQNGDIEIDFEKEIENQAGIVRCIGKGFVAVAFPGASLEDLCEKIADMGVSRMIISRDPGYIHIGMADMVSQQKISTLPGIQDVVSDKKVLSNIISS